MGAALIIAGGVAEPSYGVERLLRLRPFQWIGMISYSLYLWHWPVLTIAAERRGTDSLPVTDALLWVLLSLGLAIITYLLVENPIRHSTFLVSKRWASLALGGCLIVVKSHGGHCGDPPSRSRDARYPRPGKSQDQRSMPFSDQAGSEVVDGYGLDDEPSTRRPDNGGRRLDRMHACWRG